MKCIECKFIKLQTADEGTCFGIKIKDVKKERNCKYFKKRGK